MPPPGAEGPRTSTFQTCFTMQEVFSQHCRACPGLIYHRIPVPDFCAPREQVGGCAGGGLWAWRGGRPPPPPGLGMASEGLGASAGFQIWATWLIHISSKLHICV